MVAYDDAKLYQSLKDLGVLSGKVLDSVYAESKLSKKPLQQHLIEKDLVSDENLGRVIADLLGVAFVRLANENISLQVLRVLPEIVAKKQLAIVFEQDKNGLNIAMVDPTNKEFIEFVQKKTGDKVTPHYSTKRDVMDALSLYSAGLKQTFDTLLKTQIEEVDKTSQKDAPIAKILDTLILYAYQNKASDVHIEPEEDTSLVRFRVDGVLHDVLTLPKVLHSQLLTRVKVLSRLRTDEHLSAQDGKMQKELEQEDLDIRVSLVPVVEGEKCVMRLLSSRSRQFALSDLGMSAQDLKKVKKGYEGTSGMVLATGPTGSGKTTSIYGILRIINTRDVNIATIEDPVEYDVEGINQIQVNPKTNLTFADGLRAILRQDPDIIFVGEIRDNETAGIATNSAMTGHLVLSTLHTNDAATTLPRIIDMEIDPFLVASTVNVIVAQRLVRKICQRCKVSVTHTRSDLEKHLSKDVIKRHFGQKKTATLYKGKGCGVCHDTGYVGRVGIFEVLVVSQTIRELISAKVAADVLAQKAIEEGMTTMFDDGIEKVKTGVTTIEEVLRVAGH